MSETLDILRRQHQALADYEAARERKRGSRSATEKARVRAVVDAHRQAWLAAGGSDADFALALLLGDKPLAKPTAEPVADEPVTAERPKRRER